MEIFAELGSLQYVGIALVGVGLTVTVLFFLLREQNNIKASDGTLFASEVACKRYEAVLEKVNAFYIDNGSKSSTELFGIQMTFIKLLKEGFKDSKMIINYKEDFQRLSDLLDQDIER